MNSNPYTAASSTLAKRTVEGGNSVRSDKTTTYMAYEYSVYEHERPDNARRFEQHRNLPKFLLLKLRAWRTKVETR